MFENLKFHIGRFFSSKFILRGKCKQCGNCCRNIVFKIKENLITKEEQFEALKKFNKYYEHFYITSKDSDGAMLFTCKSLTVDNKCKDYKFRSLKCRMYPYFKTGFIEKDGTTLDNCGYYFDIDKKFDDYIR